MQLKNVDESSFYKQVVLALIPTIANGSSQGALLDADKILEAYQERKKTLPAPRFGPLMGTAYTNNEKGIRLWKEK